MARHLQRPLSAAFVFVLVALVVNPRAGEPRASACTGSGGPLRAPGIDPSRRPAPAAAPASSPLAALGRQLQDTLAASGTDAVTVTTTDAVVVISLADTITFASGKADLLPDVAAILDSPPDPPGAAGLRDRRGRSHRRRADPHRRVSVQPGAVAGARRASGERARGERPGAAYADARCGLRRDPSL